MATDNFWLNPYDEEEKERLRQHQLRMGVTPARPYGPFGGGIGPGAYQGTLGVGTPTILPGEETIRIRPTDPTSAGMSDVSMGNEVAFGNQGVGSFRYSRPAPLPVTPPGTMNFQDFLDKVGPVQSGTRDAYYMPDGTVRNAAGDLVSTDTTFDPTAGLAATDLNLQGVTPTSTVSVDPTLAGMATVPFTETELLSDTATQVAANDWAGMGIYDDLLSKKTLYDMGPGHPTVIKELIKTLDEQRNAVVNPGPTPEEIEVIIEKAISAPSGNLERIAADRAVAQAAQTGPSAADIQRDKQAAVDARNAERARQTAINAQMAQEAAARQRQQQQAVAAEQARQAQAAQAAQEATRKSLEKQMRNWQGRDEQDESAMAQIQAALDHIADLQGTGVTSGGGRQNGFDPQGGTTGSSGMGMWT